MRVANVGAFVGLALGVVVVLGSPRTAEACICPLPTIDVWPSAGQTVPTNTRIVASFALDQGWGPGESVTPEQLLFAVRGPETKKEKRAKKKKKKKDKKKGKVVAEAPLRLPEVEVTVRTGTSGRLGWVELTPTQPLVPGVRYRILLRRTTSEPGDEALVGEIVAGLDADTTAPTWSGTQREAMVAAGRGPAGVCGTTAAAAIVRFTAGSWGGAGAPPDLRYAVWRGAEAIEGRPPVAIVAGRSDGLVLGTASACAVTNFELMSGAETIIVRPIDVAGNLGVPATVVLRPEKTAAKR